jgi:hypothetical protein
MNKALQSSNSQTAFIYFMEILMAALSTMGKKRGEENLPDTDLFKFPTQSDVQFVLEIVPYVSPDWFEHKGDENLCFRNVLEGWHQGLPIELPNCIQVRVGGRMQALYILQLTLTSS